MNQDIIPHNDGIHELIHYMKKLHNKIDVDNVPCYDNVPNSDNVTSLQDVSTCHGCSYLTSMLPIHVFFRYVSIPFDIVFTLTQPQ